MKIKLTHYPYKDFQIGEIVDFGEELNKSLVSFERAVWVESSKKPLKTVIREAVVAVTKPYTPKKKLITNSLRDKVQAKKEVMAVDKPKKRNDNDDIDV